MDRRGFVIGGMAALASGRAFAQRSYRIAVLANGTAAAYQGRFDALRAALKQNGYVEGRNLVASAKPPGCAFPQSTISTNSCRTAA